MTESPLVAAYLADLDRALAGADPADRLEIVDAVREHIDAAVVELGASPTQAEIAGVLRRLGTADDVAAAWAVGADRPVPPTLLRPTAHGLRPVAPGEAGPGRLPVWLIALLVVVALVVVGPVALLVGARLLGAALGALVFLLPVVVLAGTIVCGIAWRRSAAHRGAWLAGFVVGLTLVVGTGAAAAGLLAFGTESGSSVVTVVTDIPAPTPSPGSGLP